ncbi:MAG: hypothetical protein AAGK14_11870 [Verrucomicrobiota bacterium]
MELTEMNQQPRRADAKPPIHIGWPIFWAVTPMPSILAVVATFLPGTASEAEWVVLAAFLLWPLCVLYSSIWVGFRLGSGFMEKATAIVFVGLFVAGLNSLGLVLGVFLMMLS